MTRLLVLLLALAATACSSSAGFDRGALHSQIAEPTVVTEADIRYLYLSAESDGTAGQTRPAFSVNEDTVLAEAKLDALAGLTKDVAARLASMK